MRLPDLTKCRCVLLLSRRWGMNLARAIDTLRVLVKNVVAATEIDKELAREISEEKFDKFLYLNDEGSEIRELDKETFQKFSK